MSSYLPPTINADFNPADYPTKGETQATGGTYLPLTGGTLSGPLVGTLITCDTLQADTIDATTTVEGDIITATQNGAARANTIATYNLTLNPKSTSASGNSLIQLNDHALLFTNGTNESGSLVIGPYSASSKGLRMDGTGLTTFQNDVTIMGNVIIDQDLQINGSVDIQKIQMDEVLSSNNTVTAGLNSIIINPNTNAGAANGANGLVQAFDSSLIFSQGTADGSCGLVIGPYSASSKGMRMDGNGVVTNSNQSIFAAASNQLVVQPGGSGNSFTFTGTTPSSSRTLTLPDATGTFILNAGTQTFTGVKSFSVQPLFTAASNQLAIQPSGSGFQYNINATNPAATRTYTLPDAGTAANFIMSEGTSLWTNTARIDVPNQRVTLGSPATHSQKIYMYASSASGSRLVIGESSTESRGMISTNISNSGTYGINSDIGDATRMIGLTNIYTTNQAASRGCAINFQNLGSGGSNTGRTYNDLFVNREVANASTAAFYFNGFDPTFTNYLTYHRLGYTLYSFIGGQGNAGVVLNSNTNPTGVFIMGTQTPKLLLGDGTTTTTGRTFVTGGLHCGEQFDINKLHWTIPINQTNAVSTAGAKTFAIFSPVFTSSSVNFMIFVKFAVMVELADPTRIQANNNMSSSMVTYEGTYYYNPSSSTQGLVDQVAVKQTDINTGANRSITAGSITITNSGTIFSPVFNLNVTVGGASIGSSSLIICGEVVMDINSTSGYMTSYT